MKVRVIRFRSHLHHAFEPSRQLYLHDTKAREMATNDPRVPPEVQERIRELEQELNEGERP